MDRDPFLIRIREIESQCARDPSKRRFRMERLRNEFLATSVAERLLARSAQESEKSARAEAERILKKAWHRAAPNNPTMDRRTNEEERLLTSAKVAWHKLLKTEGVAAARPRSKRVPLTALTGAHARLRRLARLQADPAEGAGVLAEYIAKHARHLLEICSYAKKINPQFLPPRLEEAVTELHEAAAGPDGR